jgi:hypothetical protein
MEHVTRKRGEAGLGGLGIAAAQAWRRRGSLPAAEANSEPMAGAMASGTNGAGGGPDITDTKLLRFLALLAIARRL